MKQTIDRVTIAFGPQQSDLALADWLRQTAGARGLNRVIKQAIREYQERHGKRL